MNPLGQGNVGCQLPPQLQQAIQQVKNVRSMLQQGGSNPMFTQVQQMCQGQDPQQVFMNLCKQRGIDPETILKELR